MNRLTGYELTTPGTSMDAEAREETMRILGEAEALTQENFDDVMLGESKGPVANKVQMALAASRIVNDKEAYDVLKEIMNRVVKQAQDARDAAVTDDDILRTVREYKAATTMKDAIVFRLEETAAYRDERLAENFPR